MPRMTRLLVAGAVVLLCAAPAKAQEITYEQAVAAWNAANQIEREVWMDNPNEAEKLRHMMIIARNWGIYPGFEPAALNPSLEPQGDETRGRCIWLQQEDGSWEERCSDWETYRCNTRRQIDDMETMAHGAYWFSTFYQAAALYAGAIGNLHVSVLFGGTALVFSIAEHRIKDYVETMEANRCVNP